MLKPDPDGLKRIEDFVKDAYERELEKEKKERFRKQVGEVVLEFSMFF